jgi:putative ABC transport system substrate-binding protein
VKRRDVITLLGGAAAWPLAARAQQADRTRRISVLMSFAANDPVSTDRLTAFRQSLQQLGWTEGENVRIDIRWGAGDADRYRKYAAELVADRPDIMFTNSSAVVAALQQASRVVPIVFTGIPDPVGNGLVANLARPGGNATGFTSFEHGFSAKWLELLKQIAPGVARVAVLRNPVIPTGIGQLAAIQSVAPAFGVEITPVDVRDAAEIERALNAFGRERGGGLIVASTASGVIHRDLIITLAGQRRLPATYPSPYFVRDGGLVSYGPDQIDQYRRAASYVDRILRGEKPADLPVQAPTKYVLVINLKTAKALGLEVPPTLLARADEAIE